MRANGRRRGRRCQTPAAERRATQSARGWTRDRSGASAGIGLENCRPWRAGLREELPWRPGVPEPAEVSGRLGAEAVYGALGGWLEADAPCAEAAVRARGPPDGHAPPLFQGGDPLREDPGDADAFGDVDLRHEVPVPQVKQAALDRQSTLDYQRVGHEAPGLPRELALAAPAPKPRG